MNSNPIEYAILALFFVFLPTVIGGGVYVTTRWAGVSHDWASGPAWAVGILVACLQVWLIIKIMTDGR
jgi:hypothetical protein